MKTHVSYIVWGDSQTHYPKRIVNARKITISLLKKGHSVVCDKVIHEPHSAYIKRMYWQTFVWHLNKLKIKTK